jgi:hypothetical protein
VARAINAQDFENAESMLNHNTPYAAASSQVGIAILRLQKDLENPVIPNKQPTPELALALANDEWDEF